MEKPRANRDMIHRSLDAYQPQCPVEEVHVLKARESGFEDELFHVGDEIISSCGSMSGVIISIIGEEALISWECRGKSVESVRNLSHTEHDFH